MNSQPFVMKQFYVNLKVAYYARATRRDLTLGNEAIIDGASQWEITPIFVESDEWVPPRKYSHRCHDNPHKSHSTAAPGRIKSSFSVHQTDSASRSL